MKAPQLEVVVGIGSVPYIWVSAVYLACAHICCYPISRYPNVACQCISDMHTFPEATE